MCQNNDGIYVNIDSNQWKHIHLYLYPAKITRDMQGGRIRVDDKPSAKPQNDSPPFLRDKKQKELNNLFEANAQ